MIAISKNGGKRPEGFAERDFGGKANLRDARFAYPDGFNETSRNRKWFRDVVRMPAVLPPF
jgi:hypothetical protein